jgi:hypothetical protein
MSVILLRSCAQATTRFAWTGIRRYGLYTSVAEGKWLDKSHQVRLALAGWKKQKADQDLQPYDIEEADSVSDKGSRPTWPRLIAQVYEVVPLVCTRCFASIRILAVIIEPEEVGKILRHLVKIGLSPPGFDPASLNLQSVPPPAPGGHSARCRVPEPYIQLCSPLRSCRLNRGEVPLSRDLSYAAVEERKSCLDRLVTSDFGCFSPKMLYIVICGRNRYRSSARVQDHRETR